MRIWKTTTSLLPSSKEKEKFSFSLPIPRPGFKLMSWKLFFAGVHRLCSQTGFSNFLFFNSYFVGRLAVNAQRRERAHAKCCGVAWCIMATMLPSFRYAVIVILPLVILGNSNCVCCFRLLFRHYSTTTVVGCRLLGFDITSSILFINGMWDYAASQLDLIKSKSSLNTDKTTVQVQLINHTNCIWY